MSHRLQVLIPDELELKLRKAAERSRISEDEWVRQAIERSLERRDPSNPRLAALERLESLDAPTGDIEQMLAEIEAGRQ
jgi:predicted transcriptional regulator